MKRAVYGVGAIVLAAVLAVLLLGPTLVNRPAVQAEIQQRLSKALQGQVTWEALDVALFPAPHGELRELRVESPTSSARPRTRWTSTFACGRCCADAPKFLP